MIGGAGSLQIKERTFDARLAGDAVPIDAVDLLRPVSPDLSGKISFQVTGGGLLDHPDLKLSASLSQAAFYGHAIPENLEPKLEATMTRGVLDGSVAVPERWTVNAKGDLFGKPARMEIAVDAADLGALLLFTPAALPAGGGGSLAFNGNLTLPEQSGEFPSGSFTVTRARLDFPGRPGLLATKKNVPITVAGGKADAAGVRSRRRGHGRQDRWLHRPREAREPRPVRFRPDRRLAPLDPLARPRSDGPSPGGRARGGDLRGAGPLRVGARGEREVPDDGPRPDVGRRSTAASRSAARAGTSRRARTRAEGDVFAAGNFSMKGLSLGGFPRLRPGAPRGGALPAGPEARRGRGPRRHGPVRLEHRAGRSRPAARDVLAGTSS